jgi:hypothetical protein
MPKYILIFIAINDDISIRVPSQTKPECAEKVAIDGAILLRKKDPELILLELKRRNYTVFFPGFLSM